jgi:hypothetical protein
LQYYCAIVGMQDFKDTIKKMVLHGVNPIYAIWSNNTINTKVKGELQRELARAILDWYSKSGKDTKLQILNAIKVVECDQIDDVAAHYIVLSTGYTARVAEMLNMRSIWNLEEYSYPSDSDGYLPELPVEYLDNLAERVVYVKDTLSGDGIYAPLEYDCDEVDKIEDILESIRFNSTGIIVVRCDPINYDSNSIYYWRKIIEDLDYCNIFPGREGWNQYIDLESGKNILIYEYYTESG